MVTTVTRPPVVGFSNGRAASSTRLTPTRQRDCVSTFGSPNGSNLATYDSNIPVLLDESRVHRIERVLFPHLDTQT